MSIPKQFDIVVFGATGFTGIRVVRYLASRTGLETKVAIAGRNKEQLEGILASVNRHESWGILIAAYSEPSSISSMANAGQIIINCVGPFRHFGLSLPEACIKAHSDYLDVCGEPEFLERTQLECHDNAVAAGSLIVGSCGFDSVPSDLGGFFSFERLLAEGVRPVTSIECFISFHYGREGVSLHYPTYESAIYGMANVSQLKKVRQKLYSQPSHSRSKPKDVKRGGSSTSRFYYESRVKSWVVPFPAADASVLRRSFHVLAKDESYRPEISVFLTVSSFWWALIISLWGAFIMLLSGFSVTRKLILQYPGFFSLGTVRTSGPSEKQMEEACFEINIFGKGTDSLSGAERKSVVRVSGPEPGYIATPIIIVEAALVLLSERDKLRFQGGVFTPAAAFQGSSLRSKLHDAGVRFDAAE